MLSKKDRLFTAFEEKAMQLYRPLALIVIVLAPLTLAASVSRISFTSPTEWQEFHNPSRIWISAPRQSRFATIEHSAARASCEISEPPEALATPDPLLEVPDAKSKVTVSFIVGTDGRVHSPLILESAGAPQDRTVLNAVRSWRYRPAKCNGVPIEAEGNIQFLGR